MGRTAERVIFDLDRFLAERRGLVEASLERALIAMCAPEPLGEAARYAVLGEGKRLRPILVLAAAEAVAPPDVDRKELFARALPLACAVELIHAYSLVHDDLPAMDDDDLRRGRPTVHKKFDEATAILVGDALLTEAFRLIARNRALSPVRRARATLVLSEAAGATGMVGGQMLDLAAEGRYGKQPAERDASLARLETLASKKTGALIAGAAELGAIAGGADRDARRALADYGRAVGLAFQIADDLLDEEGSAADVGKATGKDVKRGKKTFPSLLGKREARAQAEHLSARATVTASTFDNDGGAALAGIAQWAVQRKK